MDKAGTGLLTLPEMLDVSRGGCVRCFSTPDFYLKSRQENDSSLALFTPDDLKKAEENGAFDVDANFLGLRPDPSHFFDILKSLDRPEVASEVFVRLLEGYRNLKADSESDPLK
jgi:hypothetical protein